MPDFGSIPPGKEVTVQGVIHLAEPGTLLTIARVSAAIAGAVLAAMIIYAFRSRESRQ